MNIIRRDDLQKFLQELALLFDSILAVIKAIIFKMRHSISSQPFFKTFYTLL